MFESLRKRYKYRVCWSSWQTAVMMLMLWSILTCSVFNKAIILPLLAFVLWVGIGITWTDSPLPAESPLSPSRRKRWTALLILIFAYGFLVFVVCGQIAACLTFIPALGLWIIPFRNEMKGGEY